MTRERRLGCSTGRFGCTPRSIGSLRKRSPTAYGGVRAASSKAHHHAAMQPPPFPHPELGRAVRVSTAPFVLLSRSTGAYYQLSALNWKATRFDGCLVRCTEVRRVGNVFLRKSGPGYALKITPKRSVAKEAHAQGREPGELIGEDPIKELAALQLLNAGGGHAHLEELVEALEDDQFIYKISRWYDADAFDAAPLPEAEARHVMRQVLAAAAFMHSRGTVHRDISLENVMLEQRPDGSRQARLVDMGLAVAMPRDAVGRMLPLPPQGRCGKPACMSPEIYAGTSFHGPSADTWSCGTMLYMLLLGVMPWRTVGDELFCAIAVRGELEQLLQRWGMAGRVSASAVDLLQRLLVLDPMMRLDSVDAVLAHPWFTGRGEEAAGEEDEGGGRGGRFRAEKGLCRAKEKVFCRAEEKIFCRAEEKGFCPAEKGSATATAAVALRGGGNQAQEPAEQSGGSGGGCQASGGGGGSSGSGDVCKAIGSNGSSDSIASAASTASCSSSGSGGSCSNLLDLTSPCEERLAAFSLDT